MSLDVAKDVIKVKILRGGAYPGLSWWVLNTVTCLLITEKQRELGTEEEETM